jgi:hypothetical protein
VDPRWLELDAVPGAERDVALDLLSSGSEPFSPVARFLASLNAQMLKLESTDAFRLYSLCCPAENVLGGARPRECGGHMACALKDLQVDLRRRVLVHELLLVWILVERPLRGWVGFRVRGLVCEVDDLVAEQLDASTGLLSGCASVYNSRCTAGRDHQTNPH